MADSDGGGARLGMHWLKVRAPGLAPASRQGISPRGLDDGNPRQSIDQSQRLQFEQALADSRRVTEIAAGNDNMIRHTPGQLFHQFERHRLLALKPKWIDGVEQAQR